MQLELIDARHLGGHRFELRFNDGRTGTADLRVMAADSPGSVFAPLADETFVRRFKIDLGTLCWPGDIDVAPEYLYFLAFRDDPSLRERFLEWGYLPGVESSGIGVSP